MVRRAVGVYVDPQVDREVEHLAVDTDLTKSELYELGAKIILVVAKTGRLPEDLASQLDEQARAKLHQLLTALATEPAKA